MLRQRHSASELFSESKQWRSPNRLPLWRCMRRSRRCHMLTKMTARLWCVIEAISPRSWLLCIKESKLRETRHSTTTFTIQVVGTPSSKNPYETADRQQRRLGTCRLHVGNRWLDATAGGPETEPTGGAAGEPGGERSCFRGPRKRRANHSGTKRWPKYF